MNTEAAARSRRLSAFQHSASHRAAMSSGASGPSSLFRVAMDVFTNLSALWDEDLKVLLRSAGSDQLRRIMGVGHASLMQMDAHYATRIQLRDEAWEFAKQTMASQGVMPPLAPLAPLAPLSKSKGAGKGGDLGPPVK